MSGGFTGRRASASIDLAEVPDDEAAGIEAAFDRIASGEPSIPAGGTTLPCYRLTLERPSGLETIEIAESQVPPSLRPLVVELSRRARPDPSSP